MTNNYWGLSLSDEWYCPEYIFEDLNTTFDMDVCSPGKDKCHTPADHHVVLPQEDGLKTKWKGFIWMNPPYGTKNQIWYEKFAKHNNGIAFLTISQMPTKKFALLLPKITAILVYYRRIQMIDGTTGKRRNSPGGSMLVGLGERAAKVIAQSKLGQVYVKKD